MAPVTSVEGNGISGQSRLEAGLITVAIGTHPVLSNKWAWFGIKQYFNGRPQSSGFFQGLTPALIAVNRKNPAVIDPGREGHRNFFFSTYLTALYIHVGIDIFSAYTFDNDPCNPQ
jgi:hypothetical protein